jgi:hypothetical protein
MRRGNGGLAAIVDPMLPALEEIRSKGDAVRG